MTEQRLERIIKELAGFSTEELDVISNKITEKREELGKAKEQKFLNEMRKLITEARENGIIFYNDADELWEDDISVVSIK